MKEVKLIDLKDDVERLLTYIPWLEQKKGTKAGSIYKSDGLEEHSVPFPVYETMLLNFVNDASKTKLMDQNYVYADSRNFIKTVDDERRAIQNAGIKNGDVLCGIFSKYILGGMRKGSLWVTGVEEGILLDVLLKMKKLLEIWDAPLA